VGLFNVGSGSERVAADAQGVAVEAHRAIQEGRRVFLARINVRATDSGSTGRVVGAAEIIEAIESVGWQLEHMSYVGNGAAVGVTQGFFLFRLPHPPANAQRGPDIPARKGDPSAGG
jgi:hypothetical protein